jgi:predicted nucleotidyltransferase
MNVSEAQRRLWRKLWADEACDLERRRRRLEPLAEAIAAALKQRWPAIDGVWRFGSSLGTGFHRRSDLDLAVRGLPAIDLLDAIAVAEHTLDQEVEAGRQSPIGVDLVRWEAFTLWLEQHQCKTGHVKALPR